MILALNVMPGIAAKQMAKQTHKHPMQEESPAPNTSGSVAEPTLPGTEVSGGWKKN